MEFALDDDQQTLQATVRSFLAERAPSTYVRTMLDHERGVTDEVWQAMADLGWVGLLVPESQGGSGRGLLEMMVVLEEMGRLPLPGPFLSTAVLATTAATRLDLDDRLRVPRRRRHPRRSRPRRGGPRRCRRPNPHPSVAQVRPVAAVGHQDGRPRRPARRLGAGAGPYAARHRHLPDRGPGRRTGGRPRRHPAHRPAGPGGASTSWPDKLA
ncbi:MAG: acyl-CoA dehydrogenase family protein, partial [Acidimicrobiales bacterium]